MKEVDYNNEFRKIDGLLGYEINGYGVIKATKRPQKPGCGNYQRIGRIIKPFNTKNGYKSVILTNKDGIKKHFFVHRLVATCFKLNPNPDKFNLTNHIDGNRQNNYWRNLQWCSSSMNVKHGFDKLGRIGKRGSSNYFSKIKESDIPIIIEMCKTMKHADIAKIYNLHKGTISNIKTKRIWKHL